MANIADLPKPAIGLIDIHFILPTFEHPCSEWCDSRSCRRGMVQTSTFLVRCRSFDFVRLLSFSGINHAMPGLALSVNFHIC